RLLDVFTLGYPNEEVRMGFLRCLMPDYVETDTLRGNFLVTSFVEELMEQDIEACMVRLQTFFATIPNTLQNKTEKHFRTALYILFSLMGQYVEAEVNTSMGRIDMVLQLTDAIYIFEFKVDKSAQVAMEQIAERNYAQRYQLDERALYQIGVNISTQTRTLEEWTIVKR
ncbi:MAG: PD-(D/E)XK nuclease domain-containing protein, partial [Phocaeicola sp.]